MGEPDLDVFATDNQVSPGEATEVEVQVQNAGELEEGTQRDRVLDARGVSVDVADSGPFDVSTDETPLGGIPDGGIETATLGLEVPNDIESGSHDVTVEVSYDYTSRVSDNYGSTIEESTTETYDVTIHVTDDNRFEIVDVETDVRPGVSGDATLEIENTAEEPANDTRATIAAAGEADSAGVTIDGGTAEEFVGDLDAGETTSVTVDAAVEETVSDGAKPIEATFTYDDEDAIERTTNPVVAALPLAGGHEFSIDNVEDTLAVGYDGDVTGEITNDGPDTVDDAVLVVEPMTESLVIEDANYALPELEPGETAEFRYPTDVGGSADDGPRQLQFTVEHSASDGPIEDGPYAERVVIDDTIDEFGLESVETSVSQGETEEVLLELENQRGDTVSNVDAALYTADPLSAPNDEAFVDELGPGESTEIRFEITAEEGASTEAHPVELDFEYDTERGTNELTDTYQHPIEVTDGETDGDDTSASSIVPLAGLLAALSLGAAGFVVRKRGRGVPGLTEE